MYLRELPLPPEPLTKRTFRFLWRLFWIGVFLCVAFYVLVFLNIIPEKYKYSSFNFHSLLEQRDNISYFNQSDTLKWIYGIVPKIANKKIAEYSHYKSFDFSAIESMKKGNVRRMTWEEFLKKVGEDVVKNIPINEITVKNISEFDTVQIANIWEVKVVNFINSQADKRYMIILKSDNSPHANLYENNQRPIFVTTDFSSTYVFTLDEANKRRVYKYMEYSNNFEMKEFEDVYDDIYILENGYIAAIVNWDIKVLSLNSYGEANYTNILPQSIQYDIATWSLYYISSETGNIERVYSNWKQTVLEVNTMTEFKNNVKNIKFCSDVNSCLLITTKKDEKYKLLFFNKIDDIISKDNVMVLHKEGSGLLSIREKSATQKNKEIATIEQKEVLWLNYYIFNNSEKREETLLFSLSQ